MIKRKILVTTPDFPPKLGGLSTFSKNLVNLLENEVNQVEVFSWSTVSEARGSFKKYQNFDLFLHVHYLGGFLGGFPTEKSINFCHGSELLFTSPQILKRIVKKLTKMKTLKYFSKSTQNIFISEFTQELLRKEGLILDYSRDLIFHNCIPFLNEKIESKNMNESGEILLCSIARDVPHKNLDGVFKFAELLSRVSKRKIELFMTSNRFTSNESITYKDISGSSDSELCDIYQKVDFNLLLSRDDSSKGFVEGFGLTTLEAAKFSTPSIVSSTGGLRENIHHDFNGYQLHEVTEESVQEFYNKSISRYSTWSENCYQHLISSHSSKVFERLLDKITGEGNE